MVPMPRYEAPLFAAAWASETEEHVTPIMASGPRSFRAIARSVKEKVSGDKLTK